MRLKTHQNGKIAELEAQKAFTEMGFSVSIPITEERYDMIVDSEKELIRVQVKSGYYKQGNEDRMSCDFRAGVNNVSYKESEIDCFVVYNPMNDDLYWLSVEEAPKTSTTKHVKKWNKLSSDFIL